MVRILGVAGSPHGVSSTRVAVEIAINAAGKAGVEVELLDLGAVDVPFFHVDKDFPELDEIRRKFASSDGFVVGSPEYHGSYSGVLKNLLDHLGFEEFDGKIVGLVSTGSSFNALNHLRTVFRWVHAWVLPTQVLARHADYVEATGEITNPKVRARLEALGREVAHYARVMKENPPPG